MHDPAPRDVPLDRDGTVDTTKARGPLRLEKLEGRQESGRDDQDEAEQDEPDVPGSPLSPPA